MPGFGDMASKAKAAHEARIAAERRRDQEEQERRAQFVRTAVDVLKATVLPTLEKAAKEFGDQGIATGITPDFEVEGYVGKNPSISFRCLLPPRASDGWQFDAPAAFFTSDGAVIKVGVAEYGEPNKELGSSSPDQGEALVTQAVQFAIDAYFKELEMSARRGERLKVKNPNSIWAMLRRGRRS